MGLDECINFCIAKGGYGSSYVADADSPCWCKNSDVL